MATSTIVIYAIEELIPNKNFIIEDINSFINSYGYLLTISDFQYIKHSLNLNIKLSLSQTSLGVGAENLNYLSIKNSDESRIYYYFITNKVWRGESTIELQLSMDTLNTFRWGEDYSVDKKTLVMREHKDRVKLMEGSTLASPSFERIVHLMSEGINSPLYKIREENIIDKKDTSWSLMYQNKDAISPTDFNQVNPVDCYLMPNEELRVYYAQTNAVLNPTDITTSGSQYWFFNPNDAEQGTSSIKIKGSDGKIYGTMTGAQNPKLNFYGISLKSNGSTIELRVVRYFLGVNGVFDHETRRIATGLNYVEFLNTPMIVKYLFCPNSLPSTILELYAKESGWEYRYLDFSTLQATSNIDDSSIDRTDSKIIKIINLPYCPTPYVVNEVGGEDAISFSPNWEIETTNKRLKLVENFPFKNTLLAPSRNNPFDVMIIDWTSEPDEKPNPTRLRKDYMESKIYHSDFYAPKFVYDSFNLTFRCENLDFDKYWEGRNEDDEEGGLGFEVDFVMTRNIVSKFLFSFPRYITKYSNMDYDNVVCVSRNNEEVLYTSQYINYLRTGYNYDLKSKERAEIQMGIGLGASTIASLLGIVGGVASQNYGVAVIGAISLATQSISYAKSVADMESNISRKLEESQRQAISVKNADDLDLLTAYSNNRAKMCFYEISPTMKQALLDMFYYCGYTTQEQKTPDVSTRYWFNFLQCKLVLNINSNISQLIIDDIKTKFEEGCTFFHNHNNVWDIEQVRENYESWILE